MNTQHYDLSSRGHNALVLDTWKAQASIVDNDVIPASRENPVIQGTENQASSIKMTGGQSFTTFPLYPLAKDVNFLFQNYINVTLNLKFEIEFVDACGEMLDDLAIYLPSTSCLPSRIQLLCGNSSVWSNTFHRQEARITSASLPNAVIDKSPDYFAINKLFRKHEFPGFYVKLGSASNETKHTINTTLNLNIDLNQLTPLLSNIPFVTSEMGELRLRMFFENLDRAFCYSTCSKIGDVVPLKPVVEVLPLDAVYPVNVLCWDTSSSKTLSVKKDTSIKGIKLVDWDMSQGAEIVQSCFSITEESKMLIKKYIAQDNKITIPTQTWSTNVATGNMSGTNSELVFQMSAYNVNVLAFLFPMYKNDVVYINPLFKELDVKFNSKSVNFIPYKPFDMRIYKDTIQALLNDDCIGANTNLTESINPAYICNGDDDNFTRSKSVFGTSTSNVRYLWRDPNNYVLAFGLSPVNTFEKGFNMASSNPGSTQIRLKYSYADRSKLYGGGGFYGKIPDLLAANTPSNPLCACLCDCCLVLEYNPVVGRAQSGCLVYAEPTLA